MVGTDQGDQAEEAHDDPLNTQGVGSFLEGTEAGPKPLKLVTFHLRKVFSVSCFTFVHGRRFLIRTSRNAGYYKENNQNT